MEPHKRPQIAKAILKKIPKNWKYNPPRLQAILQSYSSQSSMVLAQKQTDQWNRKERPEINPCTYGQLIYDRDFPGGAVVKTPHSQCRGPGFDPCSGN